MSANQRFIMYVLALAIVSVIAAFIASGGWAIALAIFICVLIYALRPLVMPAGYGANKIRLLCLAGAFALATSKGVWGGTVDLLLSSTAKSQAFTWLPSWIKSLNLGLTPSTSILIFVFAVIFIVLYSMRDRSIGGNHPSLLTDDFPEENFKSQLEAFCAVQTLNLVTIDRQSNWNPQYYTELEAEVEVLSTHGVARQKKIVNLQEAIRVDKRLQSFLLLGVPGAGKSVALRKLALDMLSEVSATKRVPIYVNLREWVPSRLSENGRVRFDSKDLADFVFKSVVSNDVFSEAFVDEYFERLWRAGRLFFIFDSFDEISELLDPDQDDEVVDALSQVISKFIHAHPESKGILASRMYRRPTHSFLAEKVLEIRPLAEADILEGLSRYPRFSADKGLKLFRDRRDLVPLIRNPFIMTLLVDWVEDNAELPESQAQMYEGYISRRLDKCRRRLDVAGVTATEFKTLTMEIAWFVFSSSSFGLEVPVKLISQHFKSAKIDFVLDTLQYLRIARVSPGEDRSFAFMHRRFLEYFVTLRLLGHPNDVPLLHIPTDSRGRDALVLYAQICEDGEAERIASLCWNEIKHNFDIDAHRMRAIHCLRFLVDAFCSRRHAIASFEDQLHLFVAEHVDSGDSLVLAKICLEATGLLPEMKTVPMLSLALSGGNDWLQETAFRACRHLPRVEPELQKVIESYLLAIPDLRFWGARKGLMLSLSLSEALREVYLTARFRVANLKVSLIAAIALLSVFPSVVGVGAFYAVLSLLIPRESSTANTRKSSEEDESTRPEKPPKGPRFNLLRLGLLERAAFVVRNMTIAAVIVFCGMGLIGIMPDDSAAASTLYPGGDSYLVGYQWLGLILAALLLDWLLFLRIMRTVARNILNAEFWMFVTLLGTGVGLTILLIVYLWPLLAAYQQLVAFVAAAVLLICMATAMSRVIRGWWRMFKDRAMVGRQLFSNKVSRSEIADVMTSLLTDYGRLMYVRRLEVERIGVTGQWPEFFKLSIGMGEPITALARLEERWLGLDR